MDPERFARIRQIVSDALDLPPEEREAYVRAQCGQDVQLLEEVGSILHFGPAGEELTRAVQNEVARLAADAAPVPDRPSRVGPFEILGVLGEGGMGVVYRARQHGALEREVAVKLIRAGGDSRRVVARFEAERRTLGRMEHASIARVFDAGTTDDGRPWFAMELVEGEPFHRACDDASLGIPQRLELFLAVCRGVHHAHQRGIIHRDLKPSNILLARQDGELVPKIIDFGIAKALEEPLDQAGLATLDGQVVGTPEYMSPERLAGGDREVDVRSDVYSLGILLYELLCGELPFDRDSRSRPWPSRPDPDTPRPSHRLTRTRETATEIARKRQTAPNALRRQLRGELDWIALKAISPGMEDRYASVHELQQDVERYLAGEAVLAGPPSRLYHLSKFARRNKMAITAAAAVLLALAGGLIESNRQRVRATAALREAESVTDFLTNMLSAVHADEQGREVTVVEVLDASSGEIGQRFSDQPRVRARLQDTMGRSYDALGKYAAAQVQLEQSLATRRREFGPRSLETLESMQHVADLYVNQSRYEEAEPLYREVIAAREQILGADHGQALLAREKLGKLLRETGRYLEAESLHAHNYEVYRRTAGPDDEATLSAMNGLANVYVDQGKFAQAEPLYVDALAKSTDILGVRDPLSLSLLNNLALLRWDLGQKAQCESLLARLWEIRRQVHGDDHPLTMEAVLNLSSTQTARGNLQAGVAQLEELYPRARAVLGDEHRISLTAANNLSWAYGEMGRFEKAQALTTEALALRRRALGDDHPETLITAHNLGLLYEKMGRREEAEAILRATLQRRREVLGEDHPHTQLSREAVARLEEGR